MQMNNSRWRQSGVTLIELMISLVLGLIVTGAVLALIASIIRSNGETIQTTRLTQELRSLSDVLAMEVRRARGIGDPLANVGSGDADPVSDCDIEPVPSAACIQIGYNCNVVDVATTTGEYRTFSYEGDQLLLATAVDEPPACGTGKALNSSDLSLDAVGMTKAADGSIDVTLTGHLTSDRSGIKRTLRRVIWPRSTAVSP